MRPSLSQFQFFELQKPAPPRRLKTLQPRLKSLGSFTLQLNKHMQLTRRQFLGKTATAVLVAGTMASGKVFGANNRIRMCTIGFNGQGGSHIKDVLGMKDEAEYVALCDVDSNVLERGSKVVESAQGKAPKTYKDIRKALEDKEIDAVSIATPNHWH